MWSMTIALAHLPIEPFQIFDTKVVFQCCSFLLPEGVDLWVKLLRRQPFIFFFSSFYTMHGLTPLSFRRQ
jgi:hypothetical protein